MSATTDSAQPVSTCPSSDLTWLVFLRDGFACRSCRRRCREEELVADLIVPTAYGGDADDPENRRSLCPRCLKALPRLEGVPPETPEHPEDLQRLLAFQGLSELIGEWFRTARLAREITHGRRYSFNEWYDCITDGVRGAVGWGAKGHHWAWQDELSPEDLSWLCNSEAYMAVVENVRNLLPHELR